MINLKRIKLYPIPFKNMAEWRKADDEEPFDDIGSINEGLEDFLYDVRLLKGMTPFSYRIKF